MDAQRAVWARRHLELAPWTRLVPQHRRLGLGPAPRTCEFAWVDSISTNLHPLAFACVPPVSSFFLGGWVGVVG